MQAALMRLTSSRVWLGCLAEDSRPWLRRA